MISVDRITVGNSAVLDGEVTLNKFVPEQWDLSVQLADFEPVAWSELSLNSSGELHFSGSPAQTKVAGTVLMNQADIRLGDLIESPVSIWETSEFLRDLDLHLELAAERQVWIRDPTFDVEVIGDVDVIKDRDGVRIYGTMQSRRGNYILQNRRLRINQGDLQFVGRVGVNPDLDIRAETQVRGIIEANGQSEKVTVNANIQGTLNHPQLALTSDPVLPATIANRELSLTTFLLTGWTADVIASEVNPKDVGSVVLGIAANRLGQRLGQELNLDLVEVDIDEANISRIRVGKYLGDWLFVSYGQDMSSSAQQIGLEVEVMRGLTIEARQEVDEETKNRRTRQSLGLFWKKEW